MVQQHQGSGGIDPHDDDVTDDSVFRTVTTPPAKDRAQARFGDAEPGDDVQPEDADKMIGRANYSSSVLSLVIAAIVVILVIWLIWWLV